jgi:hypothetical protein
VTALFPDGVATFRRATDMIARGKYAGVLDTALVSELRRTCEV